MTFTFLLNSVSKMFVAVSRFNSVKNIGRTKNAKRCSVKIPQPKRFKTRNNCYGSKPRCVTIMFVKIDLTLLLPEWMLESLKVVQTFESVDKILWCDHLNKTSLLVLSNGAICFQNFTNFTLAYIFHFTFLLNFALATFGSERVKGGTRKTAREKGSVWLSKQVENSMDVRNIIII